MKLQNVGWPNLDVFIALVYCVEDIPISYDLLLVAISWSRLLFKELLHSGIGGHNSFNLIGSLSTLYPGYLSQTFEFHRLLPDEKVLSSLAFVYPGNKVQYVRIPCPLCKFAVIE